MSWRIDINCDVGEGIDNEELLFPHISSCNIACGGHAGDLETMTRVVQLAKKHQVKIGAHPSYPDRMNFGRKVMSISDMDLMTSITEQLADFEKVLTEVGGSLHHIKAHGALYNETAKNAHLAKVYLEALQGYKNRTILFVPYGSLVAKMAEDMGFTIWYEAFADRNYDDNLKLVPRTQPNALILKPYKVLEHILSIIKKDEVKTITGKLKNIQAQTYCVHGDTASALEILTYLSKELPNKLVELQK